MLLSTSQLRRELIAGGVFLAVGRGMIQASDLLMRSEEHTSELQSRLHLVCRLLLEKKKNNIERYLKIVSLFTPSSTIFVNRIPGTDPPRPTSMLPYLPTSAAVLSGLVSTITYCNLT